MIALYHTYRILAPDLPGHGSRSQEKFTFSKAVAELKNTIEENKYGKVLLVGFSLGGYLASEFACTYSNKTNGLLIQRFVDVIMCFPGLVIMLTVIALTGPGLIQVILVLGILDGIGGRVRVVRSAVLSIKESVYIEAAKAVCSPDRATLLRHILPNITAPVIILFTVSMGSAILIEATLSFLGFGVPPPEPSWGGMLSRDARSYMEQALWMALWPGLVLALVVWGINMLGDGLRDVLDPRLMGGRAGRYRTKLAKEKSLSDKKGN